MVFDRIFFLLRLACVLTVLAGGFASGHAVAQEATAADSGQAQSFDQAQSADQTQPSDQAEPGDKAPNGQAPDSQAPANDNGAGQPAAQDGQKPAAVKDAAAEEAQTQIDAWRVELDRISAALQRSGLTDDDFANLRNSIDTVQTDARALIQKQAPTIDALTARLQQLTPAAKEGDEAAAPETAQIVAEREAQKSELAVWTGITKQAQVIVLRSDELVQEISRQQQERFASQLMSRGRSILAPALWWEVSELVPGLAKRFNLLVSDWWSLTVSKLGPSAAVVLVLLLAVVVIFGAPIRRRIIRRAQRTRDALNPPPLKKYGAAAMITLVNVVIPAIVVGVVYSGMTALGINPERIQVLSAMAIVGILSAAFVYGLTRAVLAPGRASWRVIPLSDGAVSGLMRMIVIVAILLLVFAATEGLGRVLLAKAAVMELTRGTAAVLLGILAVIMLRIIAKGKPAAADGEPGGASFFWQLVLLAGWLAAFVAIVGPIFGYVALGLFAAVQLLWASSIITLLYLLLKLIDEAFTVAFQASTGLGRSLINNMGVRDTTIEQVGVILSGLVRVVLIVLAALTVLAPWGVRGRDVLGSVRSIFFGFEIGGFTFSLSAILMAVVLFIVGVVVTRGIQGWMDHKLLPRTRMDVGLKTSIRTGIGYIGVILAGMIAFSYVGLDLQNIAIVAGALSVGIGFGLQSIVNNFVSGLILLAERPIKAGDWIVVGSEQGIVRRVNVRATEIETFDRSTVIVPNSDLISGVVKNWMHHDTSGRVVVPVGVSYSADPDQVKDILLECAKEHELVMNYPAPSVFFLGFGDSSLDFDVRCYLSDVFNSLTVSSDLRFAILRRFREAGIEIPFPQQDVNLRDMDRLEKALVHRAEAAAKSGAPRRRRAASAAAKTETSAKEASAEKDADGGEGEK